RLVDPGDARVRPARPEELRDVASPGAQIVDLCWIFDVDAVQQIDGRSQPLAGELEVLRRIPGCHSWTSLRARARCAAPNRGAPDASRRRPALAAASPSSPARRSPRRTSGTGGCESPLARSRASRPRSRTAPGPWPGPDRGPAAPEPPSIYIAPGRPGQDDPGQEGDGPVAQVPHVIETRPQRSIVRRSSGRSSRRSVSSHRTPMTMMPTRIVSLWRKLAPL